MFHVKHIAIARQEPRWLKIRPFQLIFGPQELLGLHQTVLFELVGGAGAIRNYYPADRDLAPDRSVINFSKRRVCISLWISVWISSGDKLAGC